jgi:hypothetical protein
MQQQNSISMELKRNWTNNNLTLKTYFNMKQTILSFAFIFFASIIFAQTDFKGGVAAARTSYSSGKLEDTHFALQQALGDLDMIIGKEVLKLLPTQLDVLNANTKNDNVTANVGFIGATIHRDYGTPEKKAEVEIISNSPMVGTLNALLNTPILGGMMRDENNKTVKVEGYKARLERTDAGNGKFNYKLDVPFSSSLLTLNVDSTTEAEILGMANKIPMQEVSKLIQ